MKPILFATLRLCARGMQFDKSTNRTFAAKRKSSTPRQFKMTEFQPQTLDYLLVLDFEATCDNENPPTPQEIIEFPCLKMNTKTFTVESRFHRYVRPTAHPRLTAFCTELTGITQDMVADQAPFPEVMADFRKWLEEEQKLVPGTFAIITCGDWDIKSMLPRQCESVGVAVPDYCGEWINVKKSFHGVTKNYPRNLNDMLEGVGLQFEGRPHSGIDDCENIARIVKELAKKKCVFEVTGRK